jgi:hypothetical protein
VDGIIETCKIVSIIRKYIRVPEGTRINKQTNKPSVLYFMVAG